MKKSLVIFCVLLAFHAYSFPQSKDPSQSRSDTTRIFTLIAVGDSSYNTDKKIAAFRQALTLATRLEHARGILEATRKLADFYGKNEKTDSAIVLSKNALPYLENNPALLSRLYIEMGADYEKKSVFDSARFFVRTGMHLAEKAHNAASVARGYVILGNFSLNKYEYDSAFVYYTKADSVCDANAELKVSIQRAQVYNYLGYSIRVTHDYAKTEAFYMKAKNMYITLGYALGIQEVHIGLAQLYISQNRHEEGLSLLREAIDYNKNYGSLNSYTYALIVRGYTYAQMKRFDDALKDYQLYYDLVFASQNETLKRRAVYYMGYLYTERKEYQLAIEYLTRAIALCKEVDDTRNLKQSYEWLIQIYTETRNFDKLSSTYQDYITLRNELEEKEKERAIYELETKYQTQKKEQEIALLTEQNKVTEHQKRNQVNLLLALLAITIITGGVTYYGYRNKIKTAAKLKELDELKSRFFANISHEFRTPLTLIKSPLQNLQAQTLSEENRKQLSLIDQNAGRMLTLVDQLLELSRLDSGTLKLVLRKEQLSSLLLSIVEPFAYQARTKGISFLTQIGSVDEPHWIDRDVLEKIFSNLLINALKYTSENETITVETAVRAKYLHLSVTNTGVKLQPHDLNKLFERFYQQNTAQPGAGIGLSLVRELVTLYKGSLSSDVENGTLSFRITLPLVPDLLKDISVLAEETETDQVVVTDSVVPDKELPLVLIADDNADIRAVLKGLLGNDYTILEASNGDDALRTAREEVPDLVLSDVMMPGINGYDLTRTIKEDEITSFIPVILLTAKASDESHLEGLQNQADAFITKPFNHAILKTKVKQLLEDRRKLRERYSKELILRPKDITLNSGDEKFMTRLQAILDTHLSNPEFSADQFAREACMSRMQLHRKLKALLGVSSTEFLRNERLNAAVELLKKPGVSISEVAYSVGFNDADYFTQCFKEKYGVPPSSYIKQIR